MLWVSSGRLKWGPKVTPRAEAGMLYPRTLNKPSSKPPMKNKKPETEGDLPGSQKSETDERGVNIEFEFIKSGKQAVFGKIGPGQDQGGDVGHRRDV